MLDRDRQWVAVGISQAEAVWQVLRRLLRRLVIPVCAVRRADRDDSCARDGDECHRSCYRDASHVVNRIGTPRAAGR